MAPQASLATSKTFKWSGLDANQERVKNQEIVAPSQAAAVAALLRQRCLVTEIKEVSTTGWNANIGPEGVKFSYKQKAECARRLFQMQRAGISISRSLEAMAEDAKPAVAKMYLEMSERTSSGIPLSEALADHPRAFDEVFRAYVAAGEEAGTLRDSLGRLAQLMAKRAAMQTKIKGVMAYPKMVSIAITIIVFGIIMFLVPQYVKIYASFGATLPAPTLMMLKISKNMLPLTFSNGSIGPVPFFIPHPKPFSIGAIILYAVGGWFFFRSRTKDNPEVGRVLDIIRFKMPVLGKLNHKASLYRWASTLAGAVASGVVYGKALDLAAAASGSDWQKLAAKDFAQAVQSGRMISTAMDDYESLYPPDIRNMIATGELSGEVADMLGSVALTLDEDVDGLVDGLSAQIEVVMLIALGTIVGGLLIVLYMPILQLATVATQGMH